jgi:phosphopantetheinyl transferase
VIGLELMAATAAALFPGRTWQGARDVAFAAPVKVHREDATHLVVDAEVASEHPDEAKVTLASERTLKTGRVQRVEHFSATVSFAPEEAIEGLASAFLPDETITSDAIYRVFFHGPVFRVLTSVLGVSADGLVGEAVVRHEALGGDRLLTAPLVLESAFQAAGLHRIVTANQMELPLSLDVVHLLAVPAEGERLSLTVQQVGAAYHVDVDGVGGPVLRARGFAMVARGPVPPDLRFPEPDGGRPTCFPTRPTGRPTSGRRRPATDPAIAEARADDDPSPWLTEAELAELRGRGNDKRVRDRVAGRIAAKRALAELTGVDPLSIRVWSAESGEPLAEVPGHPDVRVSISHKDGRAIAVAVDAGHIGVDLEKVEQRAAPFARTWFDDSERAVIAGDATRETVAWAVKEAVLKLVGAGMACSPHDVRVIAIGDGDAAVELRGEVALRHAERGGGEVRIRWVGTDAVVVLVRCAA